MIEIVVVILAEIEKSLNLFIELILKDFIGLILKCLIFLISFIISFKLLIIKSPSFLYKVDYYFNVN